MMFLRKLPACRWLFGCLSLFLAVYSCSPGTRPEGELGSLIEQHGRNFDVLIRNGQVIDGTGRKPYPADVLIKDQQIVYLGTVDTARIQANTTIDAQGKVISPGFIDTHAHGDPFETPGFENFLAMGVTTIALGQDGFSPETEDIGQWMQRVQDTVPGVNIAMFVGHSTLRQLAGTDYAPQPTPAQQQRMDTLLQRAFDAGCFGLTTGLEYVPGTYAGPDELLALAKVVGRNQGLIMSHMRNEDDQAVDASIRELLAQGEHADVHVSHLKVVYGKGEERAGEILRQLEEARKSGTRVSADVYPYTASYTGIGILFPEWAKAPNNYAEVLKRRRSELVSFLRAKVDQRNGPEATLLGTAPYAGKTLADLSEEKDKPFAEILADDIGPTGASGAYFVMNDELQTRLIADPQIMICSDGSPTMRHPRGYGSFAKIIREYVRERQIFPLEEAVRKMTSLPAETLRIPGRGKVAVGYQADLLVFDPAAVRDRATFEHPHQLAEGFSWVLLNGKVARRDNQAAPERYGMVLRKLPQ